ncbi:uncharacterized protein EV154DRAFT_495069 [Mucor mucedo]|uniref:uncharacterized protein n=1 Tax=Mucor mucedo TaxID=29922 RepID=UPI00221FA85B|nr:uncharacterized protein EV154DRAFT_495069 [Mucor mucedo]KAI7895477.1 hypothetical protein EV154DRAFT_495069 [Mucor mucedo]
MSYSYHSNTNYSRLDYRPPHTMEDDVMSIATQDMLIDEDNASIVLDTQTISALRRARDEEVELPFHATLQPSISSQASRYSGSSIHSTRLPSIPPPPSPQQLQQQPQQQEHNSVYSMSVHGTSEYSLHRSATSISSTPRDTPSVQNGLDLGPPRSVHSDDHLPSLLHEDEDEREQSIPADLTPPPPSSSGEQKEEPAYAIHTQDLQLNKGIQVNDSPDLVDKPLVPNNFRASHDLMNDDNPVADTNWGDDDYGQSWSDNELNDTTYEPQTGILPGTFEMNQPRPHITLHKAITGKETKRLFEQRMPHNMKSFVSANELVKIKNMYFDQLVSDLQQSKENSTSLTTNDVLLLMKRQQILNDRTSISLLARKHLPREYSDRLCQAAIKYNDVYPS